MTVDLYQFTCPHCKKGHLHPTKEMLKYVEFQCMSCKSFTVMTPVVTDLLLDGHSMLPKSPQKKGRVTLKQLKDQLDLLLTIVTPK